tara:strand:+ start:1850 stop:2761 length:912 start_codon:yes stop_codon:yes gene_type:complete
MTTITGTTSLVGLVGQPVSHSLSPIMHNAAFKEMNLNWCYLAIPCETQNLETVINALRKCNCKGLNITIPHKQDAMKYCNQVSELSQNLKAVNTLIPNKINGWTGTNTDLEGFLAPIIKDKWENKNAIIIGTGGSSRAIIYALKSLKLKEINIIGRKQESIKKLLKDSQESSVRSEKCDSQINAILDNNPEINEFITSADLIINATPVGMKAKTKKKDNIKNIEMPLGETLWRSVNSKATLYDLIYTPRPTKWLEWGQSQGCKTIDGLEMLVQQGAASLRLWSGIEEIPIVTMRNAAKNYLKD